MSNSKTEPPNLDLIRMVQAARMRHDADALPSQVGGVYWIEAKRKTGDDLALTPHAGQWVIATTLQEVDALWLTIKQATEEGKLGYKSKVSTAAAPGQADPTPASSASAPTTAPTNPTRCGCARRCGR